MKPIIVDSGPLIALFNKSDKHYLASVEFISKNNRQLVTTVANITEAVYVLDYSKKAQAIFLKWISESSIVIENIDSKEINEIAKLFEKYSNVPMDFADACIVYIAERLQTNEIITVDSDFEIYRLKGNRQFKNLLTI